MSEHMGKSINRPRLCSIRISSEGAATTNILLENAKTTRLNCDTISIVSQGSAQNPLAIEKQVYKKRSRYLDEELNDSKEVIVCTDRRPMDDTESSSGRESRALIELNNNNNDHVHQLHNNQTDSEKYRETHPLNQAATSTVTGGTKVSNGEMVVGVGGGGDTSASFLLDDPVPVVESLLVMDTTTSTATAPPPTAMNCSSLRQEQFDRVAVWVQQSNKQQLLSNSSTTNGGSSRKCITHSELSGSNVSQVAANSPISYGTGDVCIDIEGVEGGGGGGVGISSSSASEMLTGRGERDPENIAQMEYNVKQFLLKQNEWSIGVAGSGTGVPGVPLPGGGAGGGVIGDVGSLGNVYSPSSPMSFASLASHNNLRTETNL